MTILPFSLEVKQVALHPPLVVGPTGFMNMGEERKVQVLIDDWSWIRCGPLQPHQVNVNLQFLESKNSIDLYNVIFFFFFGNERDFFDFHANNDDDIVLKNLWGLFACIWYWIIRHLLKIKIQEKCLVNDIQWRCSRTRRYFNLLSFGFGL